MKRAHGTIRQSQIITTFGPGAMVDLPKHSVIVGGLEYWWGHEKQPIFEDRLVTKLETLLKVQGLKLYAPPAEPDGAQAPPAGINGFQFPEWFIAQYEESRGRYRARPLVHREGLLNGERFDAPNGKKYPVVPVRFVQGCVNGHISDIDWHGFVHLWSADKCARQLWVEERGQSGDLADIFIVCDCGKSRSMAQATRQGAETLGFCRGQRPWLGRDAREKCGGDDEKGRPNRLLLRSASDAYFPQVLRVISIPDSEAALRTAVNKVWEDFLLYVESPADLARERKRAKVFAALEGCSDDKVWAEVQRRKGSQSSASGRPIKQAELETLLGSSLELGEDIPEGADFYARRLNFDSSGPLEKVDRIVLIHRLREVLALVGFTRFEAEVPDIDGELKLDVRRADLARETTWLPAVDNRGEGFFIAFKGEEIRAWLERPAVKARGEQLLAGFNAWSGLHPTAKLAFPGLPFILLHSLSHLLITAVSLECGYAASSIRERIYAGDSGYGILLYTGSPDAEGTLGGLVQVGRRLARHLSTALDLGRLCSNDPVCAQHRPEHIQEERFLHGAACHGCLLIAESSCERRNEFLDRSLVVATVDASEAAFFADDEA